MSMIRMSLFVVYMCMYEMYACVCLFQLSVYVFLNVGALFTNGRAVCFGQGIYGQLGTDSTGEFGATYLSQLPFITFQSTDLIKSMSAGLWHTCMLLFY
jgi:hypothetical protein